jgi:UPF0716 protein FxsA
MRPLVAGPPPKHAPQPQKYDHRNRQEQKIGEVEDIACVQSRRSRPGGPSVAASISGDISRLRVTGYSGEKPASLTPSKKRLQHHIEHQVNAKNKVKRPMPFLIFFLLISLPVLEVASIVEVSRWIGPLATFLLLAASVTFGIFLIRSQSAMAGRRMMAALQAGTPPEEPLLDTGAIMLAGVLFMIPGFVSDILALFLLLPAARRLMWRGMSLGLRGRARVWRTERQPRHKPAKPHRADDAIDVEFTEVPRDPGGAGPRARQDSPWGKP